MFQVKRPKPIRTKYWNGMRTFVMQNCAGGPDHSRRVFEGVGRDCELINVFRRQSDVHTSSILPNVFPVQLTLALSIEKRVLLRETVNQINWLSFLAFPAFLDQRGYVIKFIYVMKKLFMLGDCKLERKKCLKRFTLETFLQTSFHKCYFHY